MAKRSGKPRASGPTEGDLAGAAELAKAKSRSARRHFLRRTAGEMTKAEARRQIAEAVLQTAQLQQKD